MTAALSNPGATQNAARQQKAEMHIVKRHLWKSMTVVKFWNNRGKWALHQRYASCDAVPSAKRQQICRLARKNLTVHTARYQRLVAILNSTIPESNDWRTSVRIAQRPYPATESWLLSCSASEGGYGRFVMNTQGSGAGGWMQFMEGTFWSYASGAKGNLAARGYRVPASAWSWTSPLGQALTAGYMRWAGLTGSHWSGSGC